MRHGGFRGPLRRLSKGGSAPLCICRSACGETQQAGERLARGCPTAHLCEALRELGCRPPDALLVATVTSHRQSFRATRGLRFCDGRGSPKPFGPDHKAPG